MRLSVDSTLADLEAGLAPEQMVPVRMRAVYYLKEKFCAGDATEASKRKILDMLLDAVAIKGDSVLHLSATRVAFVIGQLRDARAVEGLARVLRDVEDDSIVRHECAEQ